MLKNLIVLPDGTELFSGAGLKYAIKSVKITECVNSEDELTIGSACANMVEATVFSPEGGLSLTAGDEVTLYKVDDAGTRTQVGVFTLEKPTRPTANTMKLTGYDHVAKLDKDLTEWLKSLTGWPYTVTAFAGMVCRECGLTFVESEVPNSDFQIQQFFKSGVTGRQIMRWLGEICCRFVRATATGDIEFGWYTPAQKSITPSGDPYIFAGGLSYETYQVAPVDAMQLRLADSTEGALWPAAEDGANSYIISGNAILLSHVTEDLLPYLEIIKTELSAATYTPCTVSIPANLDIRAGNIVDITDKNGQTIKAYVMTKTTSGQKDTLECTGSPRRDSSSSVNNKSAAEKAAEAENYANSAAQQAVDKQSWEDVFNKWTDNGRIQGIFTQDGVWVFNAETAKIINLIVDHLLSEDDKFKLEIVNSSIEMTDKAHGTTWSVNNFDDGLSYMYFTKYNKDGTTANAQYGPHAISLGRDGFIAADVFMKSRYFDGKSMLSIDAIERAYPDDPLEIEGVQFTGPGILGMIAEQGTSGIWTYRKWASGVAECWGAITISGKAVNTAWGSLWESANITIPDWPFAFTAVPTVTAHFEGDSGCGVEGIIGMSETSGGTTCLWNAKAKSSTTGLLMVKAIGEWK